jgi:nucleolar protein 14
MQVLVQLTPEVPFYAATVARTRLDKLHTRLSAALTDPLEAGPLLGWPGPRQLLQLRLFALLFPTSDRRHPVTTPLSLLIGKHLSQCPVNSSYQAALGLMLAGMALQNASAAARFCPEAVNFVCATLRAFFPADAGTAAAAAGSQQQRKAAAAASMGCVSRFTPGLLVLESCRLLAPAGAASSKRSKKQQQQRDGGASDEQQQQQQLPRIKLFELLSSSPEDPQFSSDAFKLQLLGCAVSTAHRVLQLSSGCGAAAPEVLQPLAAASHAVASLQGLPPAAAAAVQDLQQQLAGRIQEMVDKRQPMVQSQRCVTLLLDGGRACRQYACSVCGARALALWFCFSRAHAAHVHLSSESAISQ